MDDGVEKKFASANLLSPNADGVVMFVANLSRFMLPLQDMLHLLNVLSDAQLVSM